MDPKMFDQVLAHVSRKYNVISLQELCLGKPKSKKPLMAITFDDGYRDYLDHALPILKKHQCHSSMYVVTDCIDQNLPTWTYVMDYLFSRTKKLELPTFDYGPGCEEFCVYKWATKQEQVAYSMRFKQFLKRVDNQKRAQIIEHFVQSFDDIKSPHGLMMTWDEVRSLRSEPVEIGSHTVSHPPLATIPDEAGLEKELKVSGDKLARELGSFPLTISYPVGSYNEMVKKVSRQVGYTLGLAVNQQLYDPAKADLFEIPRIELYNESMFKNKLRINGVYSAVKKLLGK
jgi:peptidoglycan/xylan/chitin deacetylase (PgdA/CDA1 family)